MSSIILIVLNSCLFFPLVLRQGKKNAVSKKYTLFSILLGLTFGIVIGAGFSIFSSKILLDYLKIDKYSILYLVLDCFICAGLAEEASKFLCGSVFIKASKPIRKIDYILIMGGAGYGFSITENLIYAFSGGLVAIIRALFPLHIMWQLRMGGHYYEYIKARNEGNTVLKNKEAFMTFVFPVLLHGLFDFAAFMMERLGKEIQDAEVSDLTAIQSGELIGILLIVLLSFIYCVVTEVWAAKEVKKSRLDDYDVVTEESV